MGQEDVLNVLKKNKGWMITGEIMEILGQNRSLINVILRKLFKHGEVFKKEVPTRISSSFLWKYKE